MVRRAPVDRTASIEGISSRVRLAGDGLFVLGFLAVAYRLRRAPLRPRSLWLDDAWPALVTRVPWNRVPVVGLTSSGYSVVLKLWMHLVGFSEFHAQIPALAFGLLGPVGVFLAARRMHLTQLPAAIAGAIVLVSPDHIIYSSRVKQYTLDALLATIVIILAFAVIEEPQRAGRWAQLVAFAAIATAASSLVVTTVAGALLAACLAARTSAAGKREQLKVPAYAVGSYGLFAVAWWLVALRPHINPSLKAYWAAFYIRLNASFPRDLGEAGLRIAKGLSSVPSGLGLAVLIASGAVVIWRRRDRAVLVLTPVAVAVVLAMFQLAPLGAGRTDLNLYPVLALTVGLAANELRHALRAWRVLAIVLLVAVLATVRAAPPYPVEDMRSATAYLEANVHPSDEVLVYWAARYPLALYARSWGLQIDRSRHTAEGFEVHIQRPNLYVLPDHSTDHRAYEPVLLRLTRGQKRVWFIGSHGRLDAVAIQKQLSHLGYHAAARRSGDKYHAFVMLWIKP